MEQFAVRLSRLRPVTGPNAEGGDFAYGNYKGQWTDGEYMAGAAYMSRIFSPGKEPDALLCRPLALAPPA